MKRPYLKTTIFRVIYILLIWIVVVIINSCKKDKQEKVVISNTVDPAISMAQQWYNSIYAPPANVKVLAQGNIKTLLHDWSKKFLPDWNKAKVYTMDGNTYIEMPAIKKGDMGISFAPNVDTAHFDFGRSGTLTSLLIVSRKSVLSMYAMTIVADSSYLKGNYKKLANNTYQQMDKDFTGRVLFNQMDGTFVNGWRYQNGQVTHQITPYTLPVGQTAQTTRNSKIKVNTELACDAIVGVTVYQDCYYYPSGVTLCYITSSVDVMYECYAVGGGAPAGPSGGSAPSPCAPPAANVLNPGSPVVTPPGTFSKNTRPSVNVAMPPPGGGTPQPCPPAQPAPPPLPPDPCAQKDKIIAMAQNALIAQANSAIYNDLGTYHEYGTEQNLATWPANGSYKVPPISTDYNDTQFTPAFTWDSDKGYTINISHDHPEGGAPSPADVFQLFINSNNANLDNAGTAALNYYMSNASITVITKEATYVVTGADYSKLATLYSDYKKDKDAFNLHFEATGNENGSSSEYALLSIFGNSINVYKASANGTDFSPISLDANKEIVKNPCPDK